MWFGIYILNRVTRKAQKSYFKLLEGKKSFNTIRFFLYSAFASCFNLADNFERIRQWLCVRYVLPCYCVSHILSLLYDFGARGLFIDAQFLVSFHHLGKNVKLSSRELPLWRFMWSSLMIELDNGSVNASFWGGKKRSKLIYEVFSY